MSSIEATPAPIIRPATDWLACGPSVPVLVPRRADGGRRDEVWKRLAIDVWADWPVVEGHHDGPGPFNRAAALNTAADLAGSWDVAVVADADSFVSPGQLAAAVNLARTAQRLTVAHSEWVNVSMEETDEFLATRALRYRSDRSTVHLGVSSMLAVPRSVWDKVGGFDARFVGWGWEDRAFARSCEVLTGGIERVHGYVYHLAHDRPAAEANRSLDTHYRANRMLWHRYRLAGTPGQMRDLRQGR